MEAGLCAICDAFTEAAGYTGMSGVLDQNKPFTAVVAANDLLALGCFDALNKRGQSCPEDVSVTGFTDMPFVDRVSPSLTSLRIPLDELGVRAADALLDKIRDGECRKKTIRLDPELVIHGSSTTPGHTA
jgi:LacI family transcriptional regulator